MPGNYALPDIFNIKDKESGKLRNALEDSPEGDKGIKLLDQIGKHARDMDMLYANLAGDIVGVCDSLKKTTSEIKSLDAEIENFRTMISYYELMLAYVNKARVKEKDHAKVVAAIKAATASLNGAVERMQSAQSAMTALKLQWISLSKLDATDFIRMTQFHSAYRQHCAKEFSLENFEYLDTYKSRKIAQTVADAQARRIAGDNTLNVSYKTKKRIEDGISFFIEIEVNPTDNLEKFLMSLSADDLGAPPDTLWKDWCKAWEAAFSEIEALSRDTLSRFTDNPAVARQLARL